MAFLDYAEPILEHWQTILISSIILILLVVYFYGIVPYQTLKAVYPVGPTPLPFIGHLHDTIKHKGKFHLQMDEYHNKYRDVYAMFIFGVKPSIVISDLEMMKDIFVKEFASFYDRPEFVKQSEPFNSMLTEAKQEQWKRIRNTLSPAFSALKMKQMVPLINICCDNMIKKLGEVADKEESVEMNKLQKCMTMDVIVSTVFGFQVDSLNNSDEPVLKAAKLALTQTTFQKILGTVLFLMPFGMKILERIITWNMTPLMNIAKEIIRTKRESAKSSTKKACMLDLMLAAADDPSVPDSKKLSDTEVIAQAIVFLAAGYETTSTTLSFVCHHLATSPEIQDKLQQEIDSVWPDDEDQMLSYEMIHEMPYLDMVIAEALRLYPPGFIVARECTKECVIKGMKIPEGLTVVISAYSIHRDPSIYPDPERFDPERFSPEAKQSRDPYSYMPFGHGPRNCIGLRFAQMEMRMVLVRMLKKYRLEVAPDTKIPPEVVISNILTCTDVNLRLTSQNK